MKTYIYEKDCCNFFFTFLHFFCNSRFNAVIVDGHDVEALCRAMYDASATKDRPTCIVAKTYKGKGIPG